MRGYTRRKIPKGFKIHLPRQACPKCDALLDVTIENGGLIRFTYAGDLRGDKRGVTSDTDETD